MARDFVKTRDREFEAQLAQFLANLGPVKTALGLPAHWDAQLTARKNNFTTTLNSLDLANANARQAKQSKAVVEPGEGPPPMDQMQFLATDTASPYIWDLPTEWVGKVIWYRGAWSDPAQATVAG